MKRLRAAALFRLLTQMMRFAAGSLMAYSSEIGSFALLIKVVFRRESAWVVLFSMCLARALSMLVQYSINRYIVFRSRIEWSSSFARTCWSGWPGRLLRLTLQSSKWAWIWFCFLPILH